MNLKTLKFILIGAVALGAASCVYVDETLGSSLIPANQKYDVAMAEFTLSNIRMGYSDSLSAYSDTRITIGAVRDEVYGLTTRSSAFTLVPLVDTVDVGLDPVPVQFHFAAVRDTTSIPASNQYGILQNVNVYELKHVLDSSYLYMWDDRYESFYNPTPISKGAPFYDGGDTLSFDFSDEFAAKMIAVFYEDPDIQMDLDAYVEKMPGIYLTVDPPVGNGGRINMFDTPLEYDEDYYYVTGCYAELKLKTRYAEGEELRDTSFIFMFGADSLAVDANFYAFNIVTHETKTDLFVPDEAGFVEAEDLIYLESGGGLKPVFSALELKNLVLDEISQKGLTAEDVVINKATLIMPYVEPDNYDDYYLMPDMLSPTCKLFYDSSEIYKEDGEEIRYVYYANLTDASVDDEDQGDINRSLGYYSPDITHHVQAILQVSDEKLETGIYDIWMLILAEETVTTDTSNSDLAEYYQYLAYSSYYSSMYSGSYSSGSSYSNYYYYLYLANLYSSSSSTSTTPTLDKDRYYIGALYGPSSDNGPRLKITYSFVKQDDEE